jgi:hypothetical protein
MLTRGALQKCPELVGVGGGGQYDILEIQNFVGVYSWIVAQTLLSLKTIAVSNMKYSDFWVSQKGKKFKVSVLLFEDVKPVVYLQAKITFSGMIG